MSITAEVKAQVASAQRISEVSACLLGRALATYTRATFSNSKRLAPDGALAMSDPEKINTNSSSIHSSQCFALRLMH